MSGTFAGFCSTNIEIFRKVHQLVGFFRVFDPGFVFVRIFASNNSCDGEST